MYYITKLMSNYITYDSFVQHANIKIRLIGCLTWGSLAQGFNELKWNIIKLFRKYQKKRSRIFSLIYKVYIISIHIN